MNFVKIETMYKFCRNCHICRKSFLEIMKLTNKWLMELFLQADDPNYFSCFKFMCHNHHNQLCLMILRHKSTSLGYLFISQWREIISEFSWNYFWYIHDVEKHCISYLLHGWIWQPISPFEWVPSQLSRFLTDPTLAKLLEHPGQY